MGNVTIEGVQKILHIDTPYPNFPTWEEDLEFFIDGVRVKAIATHRWRGESVRIVEPFEASGDDYGQSVEPNFIGLGAVMVRRREVLEAHGQTVRDDCIRMASNTYRLHAAYLRLQPAIEAKQQQLMDLHHARLNTLRQDDAALQATLQAEKIELRAQLKNALIGQKEYQASLQDLKEKSSSSRTPYEALKRKVDDALNEIKQAAIAAAVHLAPRLSDTQRKTL